MFKSGKTTIGVEALNGNSIKNVYLDFEDEDTGDTGLYLDGFKFDYYGSEKENSHNIYTVSYTHLFIIIVLMMILLHICHWQMQIGSMGGMVRHFVLRLQN